MTVSRNDPCPCGSGKKYKKCCLGKKDWDKLTRSPDIAKHLSLRGKNILFLNGVASILGLDPKEPRIKWPDLKEHVSADHVRQIHRLLAEVWPNAHDLERALKEVDDLSGLYFGDYTPEVITQNVTRHALYSDSILVFDPFVYPNSLRPEYDPSVHPEKHITHTIMCLYTWYSLAPLVQSGVLKFIRSPADFDHELRWNSYQAELERLNRHPELKDVMDKTVQDMDTTSGEFGLLTEYLKLSYPDEHIVGVLGSRGFSKEGVFGDLCG